VNVKAIPCPAARASKLVAHQHVFPVAEVILGMPAGAITLRAQPGDRGDALAAGAEQGFLAESRVPARPQDAFLAIAEG
jgi:hypothetical protein